MKWIEDGLHFSCEQCGNCCTGSPGYVWVNAEEMQLIADYLKMPFDDFTMKYVRQVNGNYSLIENDTYECVFWEKGKGCTVYEARPIQCRTYPFWPEVIKNKKTWKAEAMECKGVEKSFVHGEGKFHSLHDIKIALEKSKYHDPTHTEDD